MASRFFSKKLGIRNLASIFRVGEFVRSSKSISDTSTSLPLRSSVAVFDRKYVWGFREYHDGRPRGPLWRGKKLIGKEALFVISGLKRFKDDDDVLHKFIKTHVLRLLKVDIIAVLTELERQQEVSLAFKVSSQSHLADLLLFYSCVSCLQSVCENDSLVIFFWVQ